MSTRVHICIACKREFTWHAGALSWFDEFVVCGEPCKNRVRIKTRGPFATVLVDGVEVMQA